MEKKRQKRPNDYTQDAKKRYCFKLRKESRRNVGSKSSLHYEYCYSAETKKRRKMMVRMVFSWHMLLLVGLGASTWPNFRISSRICWENGTILAARKHLDIKIVMMTTTNHILWKSLVC